MHTKPPILAVASHKGGTGRTTTALALAWIWGNAGCRVGLVDADPVQAVALIAAVPGRPAAWPNLRLYADLPADMRSLAGCDMVIVDCPSLTEPAAQPVLQQASAVVLTCLAELYCLRTLPAASAAVLAARNQNPDLALLGLVVGGYRADDRLQVELLREMHSQQSHLLLNPPIPWDAAIRDWALVPGRGLPGGPAAKAYGEIATAVKAMLGACLV